MTLIFAATKANQYVFVLYFAGADLDLAGGNTTDTACKEISGIVNCYWVVSV